MPISHYLKVQHKTDTLEDINRVQRHVPYLDVSDKRKKNEVPSKDS